MTLTDLRQIIIPSKKWIPSRVVFTADALKHLHSQRIYENIKSIGLPIIESKANRLPSLKGKTDAETYRMAKNTLAIVKAPDSHFKLQPIPPSADYQFHLAQGCPAHCQYCYLAGSLGGLPVVKAYGNLEEILQNTLNYDKEDKKISYEVSCYTDPLSLEYLTGSLSHTIAHFADRNAHLRWVTKFSDVGPLLSVAHRNKTRVRFSLNALDTARFYELGTSTIHQRLSAAKEMSSSENLNRYPIGFVIAPIFPVDQWKEKYQDLYHLIASYITPETDLTFEFITHRFTPSSKEILKSWYPNTRVDMTEENRSLKFNKFGGVKYVYKQDLMRELKKFFYEITNSYFPEAKILYWT